MVVRLQRVLAMGSLFREQIMDGVGELERIGFSATLRTRLEIHIVRASHRQDVYKNLPKL